MYGTDNDPLGLNADMRLPLYRLGTASGLDRPVVRIVTSSEQGGGDSPDPVATGPVIQIKTTTGLSAKLHVKEPVCLRPFFTFMG